MTASVTLQVGVPVLSVLITLAGGWFVTTRITDHWDRIKKRRDLDLDAAAKFQKLYGEFFGIWKMWDVATRYRKSTSPPEDLVWAVLDKTTSVEGQLEALLTKVASERVLNDTEISVLGAVRQAFKSLRLAVRANTTLNWIGSNNPEYAAFKGLTVYTAQILSGVTESKERPAATVAASNLQRITSNDFEAIWPQIAERLQLCNEPRQFVVR